MISGEIRNEREVVARFERLPDRLRARLLATMQRLGIQLAGIVESQKLSGHVLRNRTGHLRASIGAVASETEAEIATRVGIRGGPTIGYGRAHEFGFRGDVTVREHLRKLSQAWGRPVEPREITVGTHTRKVNLPERSYLRSALAEFGGTALQTIRRDVATEVRSA